MARLKQWILGPPGLVFFAVAGLLARLALIAHNRGTLRFYDERDYDALARALLDGRGLSVASGPSALRPPGQPIFVAAVYALAGRHPIAVELVQAVLLLAVPFAVARLTLLISRRPAVSILAGAFSALHPGLAYASATLYPTALTTVALTVGLWLCAEALERGGDRRAIASGALLGIAGAATTYLAVLPALAALIALASRRARVAALIAAVGLLPALAWSARNACVLGTAGLSTSVGFNLALGANDQATPRSGNWIEPPTPPGAMDLPEAARDRAYRAEALRWIAAHPARYATLTLGRTLTMADSLGHPRARGVHDGALARTAAILLYPLLFLGLVGLWQQRRRPGAWLVGAALGVVVASAATTIAKPRFRFPCDPLLTAFAAAALGRTRVRERRTVAEAAGPEAAVRLPTPAARQR